MELLKKANGNIVRTEEEKEQMIEKAAAAYGEFLNCLGFDYKADPQSEKTPWRVAKMWVNDIAKGSMNALSDMTAFPNSDGYTGIVCQTNIPVNSFCCHHNLPFIGVAHVAYIPGTEDDSMVIGLSKLNRIVEWFAQRPNIQESLTKQIHSKVNELCVKNRGVAVIIESQHLCVRCRGVKHDSVMKTSELSGYFFDNEIGTRQELFNLIQSKSL